MPRTRPAAQMHGNIGIPASTHEVSSAGLRTHFRGRGAPVPLAVGVTISYLCVRVVGRRGARERGEGFKGSSARPCLRCSCCTLCSGVPGAMCGYAVVSAEPGRWDVKWDGLIR